MDKIIDFFSKTTKENFHRFSVIVVFLLLRNSLKDNDFFCKTVKPPPKVVVFPFC
jgi:hypothetical protein